MKNKKKSSDKKDVISQKYTWRVAGTSAIRVLSSGRLSETELSFVCSWIGKWKSEKPYDFLWVMEDGCGRNELTALDSLTSV